MINETLLDVGYDLLNQLDREQRPKCTMIQTDKHKIQADRSLWWNRPPVWSGTRDMYTVTPMTEKIS